MLNGAVTIGTLDGANVEIREAVGPDNFLLFGLTAAEVASLKRTGYRPADYVERNDELRANLDLIRSGQFSRGDRETFRPLLDSLLDSDPFLVLADFAAYIACQEQVDAAWSDTERWTRMSIANTAHAGIFSSDRAVNEYASRIWGLKPLPVTLE
jgi:starch phosphorylase